MFVGSATLISLGQEPSKGNSEVPEHLHTDITDIRYLFLIVSAISMICSGILLQLDIKRN
jgi:hypothetical protein